MLCELKKWRRTGVYLDALVRAQVEIEFGRVCDAGVDRRAGRDVTRFARLLLLVGAEQPVEKKRNKFVVNGFMAFKFFYRYTYHQRGLKIQQLDDESNQHSTMEDFFRYY